MDFVEQIKKMSLREVLIFMDSLPNVKGYKKAGLNVWPWVFVGRWGDIVEFRENGFDWEARYNEYGSDDWYYWPNHVRMTKAELYSTDSYKNIKRAYDV